MKACENLVLSWQTSWEDDGATLQTLVFNLAEVRWIFRHVFRGRDGETLRVLCETKVVVDYAEGLAAGALLTMRVVLPERLGQEHFVGVDISPGAKTHLDFTYNRDAVSGDFHCGTVFTCPTNHVPYEAAVANLPFPAPECIALQHGGYEVPYLRSSRRGEPTVHGTFRFPRSIRR